MKRLFALALIAGIAIVAAGQQPDAAPGPDAYGNYSVKAFGAKGDAVADDTDEIQAAIDAACGPGDPAKVGRLARGNVLLPPGTYRVSKPLRIASVSYLRFLGAGKSTRIYPVGTMDSVLDLNGVAYSTFADFRIEGTNNQESIQNAIYFYWDQATATRSSCGNEFRDIQIQGTRCITGFRIGKSGSPLQVDTSLYTNLIVAGGWQPGEDKWYQHGFYVGSDTWGNNLVHTFTHIGETGFANGFTVSPTNFCLTGASLGQNGTDFNVANLSYFSVTGVRSEESQRFANIQIGPSAPGNWSFNDILWEGGKLADDNVVIRGQFNGCLRLNNIAIGSAAKSPKILINSPNGAALLLDGFTCAAPLESLTEGSTPKVSVIARGYSQIAQAGGFGGFAASKSVPPAPETLRAKDLVLTGSIDFGDGRRWTPQGLFMDPDSYWTPDGLYPGLNRGIKWKGSGTLIPGPDESFRFVGWEERPLKSGNRRQGWIVPPLKGKDK